MRSARGRKTELFFMELHDGRIVGFPAARFRILANTSDAQLAQVQLEVNGYALRWEELHDDIADTKVVMLPPQAAPNAL